MPPFHGLKRSQLGGYLSKLQFQGNTFSNFSQDSHRLPPLDKKYAKESQDLRSLQKNRYLSYTSHTETQKFATRKFPRSKESARISGDALLPSLQSLLSNFC
jgi:hypothetical protein